MSTHTNTHIYAHDKTKQIKVLYDPAIALLNIHRKNLNQICHAKKQKQFKSHEKDVLNMAHAYSGISFLPSLGNNEWKDPFK